MPKQSLQQKYFSQGICFGCGPLNKQGLQINSFPENDKVICDWQPKPYHQAFEGILNGGIIGALLDCHSNWTAAYHLMQKNKLDHPPCTVTAEYAIKLLAPTPADKLIRLEAWVIDSSPNKAKVRGELLVDGKVYDTCEGVFVAVRPGHPAYHRW